MAAEGAGFTLQGSREQDAPSWFEIRRATEADADAVAAVHARAWPEAYRDLLPAQLIADVVAGRERRAEAFRRLLADPTAPRRIWVATAGDEVIGMAVWTPSRDDDATDTTADLEALYLDPRFWRRGVGRRLIYAVVDDITHSGYGEATLWVLDTNERARRFYEATGWRPDGATKIEQRPAGELREVRYSLAQRQRPAK